MWARIESNRVVEITGIDPDERFHSSLIWRVCSDDVVPGWLFDGGEYVAPADSSEDDRHTAERNWRTIELAETEWIVMRHRGQLEIDVDTAISSEQFKELLVYMQTLRDWPQSPDFPDSPHRPTAPLWIAGQTQ